MKVEMTALHQFAIYYENKLTSSRIFSFIKVYVRYCSRKVVLKLLVVSALATLEQFQL